MNKRRSHHKIGSFPDALQEAVNRKLVEGFTYEEVTDFLNGSGMKIGKSSVARYGKDFLSRLEQLKVVKEQARAIVVESGDAPATEMAEAANQLAIQMIMEILMEADKGRLEKEKLTNVLRALAQLEKSSVARETLKLQWKKKFDGIFRKVREEIWSELGTNSELYEQVIAYVGRVEQRVGENVD